MRLLVFLLLFATPTIGFAQQSDQAPKKADNDRRQHLWNSYGTYNAAPVGPDGRADVQRLAAELTEMRANTYNWLIWYAKTDWDDLKRFLPLAREKGILVWVTIVPPSESPPRAKTYSEPFRLDYERWGEELARLSVAEPSLVAWSIDDFTHNLGYFTPARLRRILDKSRAINPRLAFVPCCYYPKINASLIQSYEGLFDAILFPYRHDSAKPNLQDASLVDDEVRRIKSVTGPDLPIIVDVYSSKHSWLGTSTPQYVREVMVSAKQCADGVHVFRHPDKDSAPEKYAIVRELLRKWAATRNDDVGHRPDPDAKL